MICFSFITGTLIYKLKGFDPDGDALEFGVQSTYDSDIISVKNIGKDEAGIYLEKELDREVNYKFSSAALARFFSRVNLKKT